MTNPTFRLMVVKPGSNPRESLFDEFGQLDQLVADAHKVLEPGHYTITVEVGQQGPYATFLYGMHVQPNSVEIRTNIGETVTTYNFPNSD